jgi:hypothetical protein
MKTYFYRRADGTVIRIEAEQMFWSGVACIFVKGGLAVAVISLLPGELVCEENSTGAVVAPSPEAQTGPKPN